MDRRKAMDLKEFLGIFEENCEKNGIKFNKEKTELLFRFMNLILEWNEKINVTAIKDEKEFIVKHFIDSLVIGDLLGDAKNVLDIGTGGGFPGIPLKIYYPEKEFTLIDSVNKKVTVVNDINDKLGLSTIEALHIRAEDLARNSSYREQFDLVVTRAVSKLSTIVEYMLPFTKVGGRAICMKGPNAEQEILEAKTAIFKLGGEIENVEKMCINNEFERNVIVIKKIKKTEEKYPRGQGKPAKEPIQ